MITNAIQLEVALHQLTSFREMLEAMRLHLQKNNPALFPTLSEGYLKRIHVLENEIIEYLRERPAEAPLLVKVSGPQVKPGVIKATTASQLISGLQSAIYQIGGLSRLNISENEEVSPVKGLRSLLGLNLVATMPGSFVLAMDLGPRQLLLFEEYDIAASAVEKLIHHVNELQQNPQAYSGDRPILRGLRKVASVVKRGIETIDIVYREDNKELEATFTPIVRDRIEFLLGAPKENEKTVVGRLIEINVENHTCKIHPENEPPVDCAYEDILEDDLIAALKQNIEMAGQFIPLDWPPGHYRITKIERFRILNSEESEDSFND